MKFKPICSRINCNLSSSIKMCLRTKLTQSTKTVVKRIINLTWNAWRRQKWNSILRKKLKETPRKVWVYHSKSSTPPNASTLEYHHCLSCSQGDQHLRSPSDTYGESPDSQWLGRGWSTAELSEVNNPSFCSLTCSAVKCIPLPSKPSVKCLLSLLGIRNVILRIKSLGEFQF